MAESQDIPEEVREPEDWRTICTSHLARMSYALEHGVFSDVSFLVGDKGEVIRGHRSLLSIGSPVFQALLTGKAFDENPIPIKQVQPSGFKPLIKYLYTGQEPEIPDGNYMEFLKAVKFFMVGELYKICSKKILEKMSLENAISIYENSKFLKEEDLENAANAFIKENAGSILIEPKFLELSAQDLAYFISCDDFSASEILICQAVYRWGQAECIRQKLEETSENIRYVLKNIIPHVRFPLMDRTEFSLKIAPLNMLTLEETVAILLFFNIPPELRCNVPEGGRFISKPRVTFNLLEKEFSSLRTISVHDEIEENQDDMVRTSSGDDTGLRIGTSYTISNKGLGANYMTCSNARYRNEFNFAQLVTKDIEEYEYNGENYNSTHWLIRPGSELNTYSFFLKSLKGNLTPISGGNGLFGIIKPGEKGSAEIQNLTIEFADTPGYFILSSGMEITESEEPFVLSCGHVGREGIYLQFIEKPEEEDDTILWNIQGLEKV